MSIQCSTCGIQTRNGAKFCHACGTPIATTALPSTLPLGAPPPVTEVPFSPPPSALPTTPQAATSTDAINASAVNLPSAYLAQTPQTYHTAPPPLAPMSTKKSNNTVKIVLISLTLLVVLGVASIIGAVFFISKKASQTIADIKQKGLPTISSNAESVPDEKLGVPIYPGAKRESTISGGLGGVSGAVVTFSTPDDVAEVADFYRSHWKQKPDQQINEISDTGDSNQNDSVVFQLNGEGGPRVITIAPKGRNGQSTEIVIIVGNGVPGLKGIPPPPPPPAPRNSAERRTQEIERRALEQAERAMREAEKAMREAEKIPVPPPPPQR